MKRIQTVNREADKFGPGKDGFRSAVPGVSEPTYLSPDWCNGVQESLIGIQERAGLTPLDDNRQVANAIEIIANEPLSRFAVQAPRAFDVDGTLSAAVVPRVAALGTSNFTIGCVVYLRSLANSPGLFGGLAGALQVRIAPDGMVSINATSVANVGTSSRPISTLRWVSLLYTRKDGIGVIDIDGAAVGTFPDATNYSGEIAFLGSADGVNGCLDGLIANTFVSSVPLSKAARIALQTVQNGIPTLEQLADCNLAMDAAGKRSGLVIGPMPGTKRTVVLPPTGAKIALPTNPLPEFGNNPRVGNLYISGDSQAYCFNASGSPVYTDTSNARLLSAYRWPDIYATSGGRNLTVHNLGVTGSGLRYVGGQPVSAVYAWQTQFYAMGQMPINWTGTYVMMNGWNDFVGAGAVTNELLRVMRRAMEACTARAVIAGYGGVTTAGAYYVAPLVVAGWVCTGSDETLVPPSEACNPFPISGGGANTSIRKIRLAPGQFLEFTVLDVERIALFFESFSAGAPFTISINGDPLYTDSCATTIGDFWPMVVWLERVNPGDSVRVTAGGVAGQSVIWHAAGYFSAGAIGSDRTVIVATTSGNPNNHTLANIQRVAQQAALAAATHADMGVMYVDFASSWQAGDSDGQDLDHLSPQGNLRLAAALSRAAPIARSQPEWVLDLGAGSYMSVAEAVGAFGVVPRKLTGARLNQIISSFFPSVDALLDYPNIPPGIAHDELINVAGAVMGKAVSVGRPAPNPGLLAEAWVDSPGVVRLRLTNNSSANIDPALAAYRITVLNI